MDQFDTSDEETENGSLDTTPLKIDWLDLSIYGCTADLGITSLPGCKFKDTWRCMKTDVDMIKSAGVKDVFVLCTNGELKKYRVKNLLTEYKAGQITVHHHPFFDGMTLAMSNLMLLLEELKALLTEGHKTLIHCYGGLGRSSLVACCLLMFLDPDIDHGAVIDKLKSLRGSNAIQSVKQYNFITEFRDNLTQFKRPKLKSVGQSPDKPKVVKLSDMCRLSTCFLFTSPTTRSWK